MQDGIKCKELNSITTFTYSQKNSRGIIWLCDVWTVEHTKHFPLVNHLDITNDKKFWLSSFQVIDLATYKEDNKFYFYKDTDHLHREPHEMTVHFEDNLLVSEEVYAHHVLCTHSIW